MQTQEVAGGRLAASAQPQLATSFYHPPHSSSHTPQPFSQALALRTNGKLREGLRCFPANRPLPATCSDKTRKTSDPGGAE